MALQAGQTAPDFELVGATESGLEKFSLSSHLGKDNVVLLFVPGAFTGVCTQELCDVSGGVHNLSGAVTYGISSDTTFAQSAWAKANNITVQLLADRQLQAISAYDVVLEDFAGQGPASQRAVFVINKAGEIVYSQVTNTPGDLPDFTPVAAAVASLA